MSEDGAHLMMFDGDPREITDYEKIQYYKARVQELEQVVADLRADGHKPDTLWAIHHLAGLCREYARHYKGLSYSAPNIRANDRFRGAWRAYERVLELLSVYDDAMAPNEEANDGPDRS